MDSEVLLQTHAEMAIAITGFASVIAALSRPLTAFARQRFFSLLALSVIQILGLPHSALVSASDGIVVDRLALD